MQRLNIASGHVRFVPADFTVDEVGPRLSTAGFDPARASLMLCEGVAAYLEKPVLAALLRGFAEVAAPRSQLAVSLSVASGSPGLAHRRAKFQAGVAALGEPAHMVLTADDAGPLLMSSGWRPNHRSSEADPAQKRARRMGLLTAEAARPV